MSRSSQEWSKLSNSATAPQVRWYSILCRIALEEAFSSRSIYRWERPLSAITAIRFGMDLKEAEIHYALRTWEQADSVARAANKKQRSGDM
jgi:hypothetical protein